MEAGREISDRAGAAYTWWLSSCSKKLSVGLVKDAVWRYWDFIREFGILLTKGSGSVFGLGFNFDNGSGSANRTAGGDDLRSEFVAIDSEDLRLGFKLDRLGLGTDDEKDDTLGS
jgi:hypothetical protein